MSILQGVVLWIGVMMIILSCYLLYTEWMEYLRLLSRKSSEASEVMYRHMTLGKARTMRPITETEKAVVALLIERGEDMEMSSIEQASLLREYGTEMVERCGAMVDWVELVKGWDDITIRIAGTEGSQWRTMFAKRITAAAQYEMHWRKLKPWSPVDIYS
jgi:hypothetical protein